MTNIGYWMWPHQFQLTCSAKSGDAIRKNAIFQPLYALSYFFIFLIGFAALLVLPKLKDSNAALLTLISTYISLVSWGTWCCRNVNAISLAQHSY